MTLQGDEAQLSLAQRFRIARAQSRRLLASAIGLLDTRQPLPEPVARRLLKDWDESKHPRVPAGGPDGGQFGEGGGGAEPDIADAHLDPKVVAVGGDAWNKATARRLEREYQTAKPELQKMLDGIEKPKGEGGGGDEPTTTTVEDDEDDTVAEDPPYVPESWDELSLEDQSSVEQEYFSQELEKYVDSEKENWQNNGGGLDEAKATIAASSTEFLSGVLKDYIEGKDDDGNKNTDTEFPYTVDQLAEAITLDYESDGEGHGDLDVNFDDDALTEPASAPPKEQGTLPGIEPEDLSKRLTPAMREELTKVIEEAFDEKADDTYSNMDPPEYLADQAKEYMEENWTHNMDDKEKFGYAKHSTSIINDLEEAAGISTSAAASTAIPGVPKTFDPLNETSGDDYKKTQYVARTLSLKRAEQVLADRKIELKPGVVAPIALRRLDNSLWSAWKSSSTSEEGQLLQVAVADELGGRLNPKTGHGGKVELDRDRIIKDANDEYEGIGGYAAIKAYVRAKWETTQFLLDKAGLSELQLYRGISLDPEKYKQAEREKMIAILKQMVEGHAKVPNLTVVRNGAASTSVNASVSNGWSSSGTRVVLRASVPRTAAVSIPAYGINVQTEQEVVVAGTAWKAWDAWINKAPTFDKVAMAA